jgi:hypothetical protein
MQRLTAWLALANGLLLLVAVGLAVAFGADLGGLWLGTASTASLASLGLFALATIFIAVVLAFLGPSGWDRQSATSLAGLLVAFGSVYLSVHADRDNGTLPAAAFLCLAEIGVGVYLIATNSRARRNETLGTAAPLAGFVSAGLFLLMIPFTFTQSYETVWIAIAAVLAYATWSVTTGIWLLRNPMSDRVAA